MSNQFRQLLEAGDFKTLRRGWAELMPNMPQPRTDAEAEQTMHVARTVSVSIPFRLRAYSHRWLTERNLPSQLPDNLRPRAERMYPQVVEAVGIGVNFTSRWMKPAAAEVQGAMSDAVEECFADGERDPVVVKARMFEAKEKTMKALFGKR